MTFPHTKMDLDNRLSEAMGNHRKDFLLFLSQQPSEILKSQGIPKERQEDTTEDKIHEQVAGHFVPAKKNNPGSALLNPSDRDRFINWGKKKAKKRIQEGIVTLRQELNTLRPQMAAAAQKIYDLWDQSEDGHDDEYGGGGPCDEIASELYGIISGAIDAHIDEGGHDGDDHAFIIVSRAGERYWVDIPPNVYESGGGYNWTKIPNVIIKPEDVVIEPI